MEFNLNSSQIDPSEDFRNQINTMDQKGKRKWVYPRKPRGRYYHRRTIVSWFLLLFFLSAPFITIQGDPLLKFDVFRREFFIFSFPFYPQDFFLFALATIITLVFIILFTVVYGRVFCGWLCPQTIFLEMLFRKIEYAIEGNKGAQQRLDQQAWDEEKIKKKLLKWFIFALLSLLMSHVLLAYFLGADVLFKSIEEGPFQNMGVFLVIFINAGVVYFVYSWFREQACTLVCPYGRLQSVLIDQHTIVVAYDYQRGEGTAGRAKFKKGQNRQELGKGDCIDCNQCVAVCPTGIDIRNGTQLECINCTACMDACDEVMDKIGKPRKLVRYASQYSISTRKRARFRFRTFAYTTVLVVLSSILVVLLAFRSPVEAKILRAPGSGYSIQEDHITNFYEYTLINKSSKAVNLHFKALCCGGKIYLPYDQKQLKLRKGESYRGKLRVVIEKKEISQAKTNLRVGVYNQNGHLLDVYTTAFLGPFKF